MFFTENPIFKKNPETGKRELTLAAWGTLCSLVLGTVYGFTSYQAPSAPPNPQNNTPTLRTTELDKTLTGNLDSETINSMNAHIKRETDENNGFLPPEREQAIRQQWMRYFANKQSAAYRPDIAGKINQVQTPPPPQKTQPAPSAAPQVSFAERVATEKIQVDQTSGARVISAPSTSGAVSLAQAPAQSNATTKKSAQDWSRAKNILPIGTFIPCSLLADVRTSDLTNHVWANVELDVTFRRQLQLPKGLVRLRGATAREPVQNRVDLFFDLMLFSDGTELPIKAFAYAAEDPRYPNSFQTRGLPGELTVPDMYVQIKKLLYTAGLGAADGYIQAYTTGNTSTTTIGNVSTTTSTRPLSPSSLALASASKETLHEVVEQAKADLQKYKPFVTVEKGTPFFVQLDATVDVNDRRINGLAIAQAEEEQQKIQSGQLKPNYEVYAPGDARAKYVGPNPSSNGPVQSNPLDELLPILRANPPTSLPQESKPSAAPSSNNLPAGTAIDPSLLQLLQNIQTNTPKTPSQTR